MSKPQFVVIGLGNFGYAVARTLAEKGCQVLCIDKSEERLERIRDIATHAVQADAADGKVLREVGVAETDCAVVSLGRDIEASLLVVMALRDIGVKKIVVKAVNPLHGRILKKLGVDRLVFPESDMGRRVAEGLITPSIRDYLELGDGHGVAEVIAPTRFWDKSLADLHLRTSYGVTVLVIRRASQGMQPSIVLNPSGTEFIREGDTLIAIGREEQLANLSVIEEGEG